MSFHRTPAEMAADTSFARSPIGESVSRHLLWLTDEDMTAIGAEPTRDRRRIDFSNPGEVAAERASAALWSAWWGRACDRVSVRRREALSDETWAAEFMRLIADRRAAGPAELARLQAEWDAYDRANPERGLTADEEATCSANWAQRSVLTREHRRLSRHSPDDPRLAEIIAELRECDRVNDSLYDLKHSRSPAQQAA